VALAVARQAKGWTQAELAEKADVSQSRISKVEAGQLELEDDALTAVASALEVPQELLAVREPNLGIGVSCVHHRRRKSKLTATSARRIEGLTQLVSLSTTRLVLELPRPVDLDLPGLPIDEFRPIEAAQRLRSLVGIDPGQPIADVIGLAEKLGVVVVRRDFGTDAQDGVSLRLPDRRPVILLNTALPADRERINVAHELGHLIMHGWQVASGEQAVEDEAFQFAGELLTPQSALRGRLAALTAKDFLRLLDLKLEWGMSISALIEQAKRMGAVDEQTHRTLRIRLNTLGWNKVEPGNVAEESPQLINQVVDAHLDDMRRSSDKTASVALMLPEPFTRHFMAHRQNTAARDGVA
jgi:Zn-dependent peptidase ImmA (M78 family)/transcriptional regulator with XRE-family HTH domain